MNRFMRSEMIAIASYGWVFKRATKAGRKRGWYRKDKYARNYHEAWKIMREKDEVADE